MPQRLASFYLGVRLKNATLKKLGSGSLRLGSVDLSNADSQLSMRGQMALRELEGRVHEALKEVARKADGYSLAGGNKAVFVVARYCTVQCHLRVLILCCAPDGVTGWSPVAITSLGGAPIKGGTWGILQLMSSLATSMCDATGTAKRVGVASGALGSRATTSTDTKLPCQGRCQGQGEAWWDRPLSLASVLPSGGCDDDADDDKDEVDEDAADGAGEEMDFAAALELARAYRPGTATACSESDLRMFRAAFCVCSQIGITAKSKEMYGSILTANRMMDREMAEKLGYFTRYASLLAEHAASKPELAIMHSRRFEDFCEDFGDAIGMATRAEKAVHEAGARAALGKLTAACEAAGIL